MSAPIISAPIALAVPSRATLAVHTFDQHTTLAVTTGTGRIRAIDSFTLDRAGRDALLTALLDWHYVEHGIFPDDEVRVLLALTFANTDELEFGYLSGSAFYLDGPPHLTPVEVAVYAWAHIPGLPVKRCLVCGFKQPAGRECLACAALKAKPTLKLHRAQRVKGGRA